MREKEKRQELISKLYIMVRDANQRKGGVSRIKLIYEIDALASFMYYAEMIKLHEYQRIMSKINHIEDEKKIVYQRQNEVFKDLYENNPFLLKIYEKELENIKDLRNKKYDTSCNYDEVYKLFMNFLEKIDCYSLFKTIKENEHFVRGSKKVEDGICVDNIFSSFIILGQIPKNTLEFFMVLSHEIGHAYTNKILQSDKINYYDGEIYREIIPLLFEKMFLSYLEENHFNKDKIRNVLLNREQIFYYNLSISKEVCDHLENQKINRVNYLKYKDIIGNVTPFIHHTTIGFLISNQLYNDYIDNEQIFVEELPYIIKGFQNNEIKNLLGKYYQKNKILKK